MRREPPRPQGARLPGDQLGLVFEARDADSLAHERSVGLRRIAVANEVLRYRLQRVRRRTIGFQINDAGLTIRAPRWITLREIESAIVKNHRWIRNRQLSWQVWRSQQRSFVPSLQEGGTLRYLGQDATLRWLAGAPTEASHFDSSTREVRLAVPLSVSAMPVATDGETLVRQCLQEWLQAQARRIFAERLGQFADRIDARFAGWRLSSARTQWGSCSHAGRVRLNWRLVHFPLPVIDYVIAHELAHLRELNHSPRFWKAVAQLLPGFEPARDQIKRVDISALLF